MEQVKDIVYVLHEPQCCGQTVLTAVFKTKQAVNVYMQKRGLRAEYYAIKEFEVIE